MGLPEIARPPKLDFSILSILHILFVFLRLRLLSGRRLVRWSPLEVRENEQKYFSSRSAQRCICEL